MRMLRAAFAVLCLLLLSPPLFAQQRNTLCMPTTLRATGRQPLVTPLNVEDYANAQFSYRTTGTPTGVSFTIEAGNFIAADLAPAEKIAALTNTTGVADAGTVAGAYQNWYANVSTLSGGTSPTLVIKACFSQSTFSIARFATVPTFPDQSANVTFSGPASGADATPSFRALVLADLPEGTANQLLKTNAGATSLEHVTLGVGVSGTDFAIAHAAGTTTFNLPDASATARGAVTTGAQTIAGAKTFSGDLVVHDLNETRHANAFAGADGGDQIAAAYADLPAGGGFIDARGLEGGTISGAGDLDGSNFTILFGCGTYTISIQQEITGSNIHYVLQPCTILQSGAGVQTIFRLSGSATDIIFEGGVIDGNSIGRSLILTAAASSVDRVTVRGVELANGEAGQFGGGVVIQNAGRFLVEDNYIHDTRHGIVVNGYGATLTASNNRIVDMGLIALRCIAALVCNFYENVIDNPIDVGIYLAGVDHVSINNNTFLGGAASTNHGIHADVGVNKGTISGNNITDPGASCIFIEDVSFIAVEQNVCVNAAVGTVTGIAAGMQGSQFTATQKNALDVTTGLTANTNITLNVDGADSQEGAASVEAIVAAAFTTGFVFYQNFGAADADYPGRAWQQIWVKSTAVVAENVLSLCVSPDTNFATNPICYDLPRIPSATWVELRLYADGWKANADNSGVVSWGIVANSDPGAITLNFDDYRLTRNYDGIRLAGNKVFLATGFCYSINNITRAMIEGNYCEDPGFRNGSATARIAYDFRWSTATFKANSAFVTDKGSGFAASTFIRLRDSSTIKEDGSFFSGFTNTNSVEAGSALNQTTVTFSATPTFNASLGNSFKITLTGNVTSSTLSNALTGQQISWIICQDATGSRTFVWPTNVKGGMTIGSTLSTCSAQTFLYDGTNAYAVASGVTNM